MTNFESFSVREQLRQSEAMRGYRVLSYPPNFKRACLACDKITPEGEWCCIGWVHHLNMVHGQFVNTFKALIEILPTYSDDGKSCSACAREAGRLRTQANAKEYDERLARVASSLGLKPPEAYVYDKATRTIIRKKINKCPACGVLEGNVHESRCNRW